VEHEAPHACSLFFWRKIVLKKLIPAIALAAMLLAPSLASAAVGNVGAGPRINVGSIGTVRVTTVPPRTPPRIQSKIQLLNCHTYERRSPYHDGVITRTVCK
jgi:hypothetical protein